MSKTQTRSRKRLVALGASIALGAGVLVPLAAASPASAAAVYSANGPTAVRAAVPTADPSVQLRSSVSLNQGGTGTPAAVGYGLIYVSGPTGATISTNDPFPLNFAGPGGAVGRVTVIDYETNEAAIGPEMTFSTVGTYQLAVCRDTTPDPFQGCNASDPIVTYLTIKAAGQIGSFTITPATTAVPNNTPFNVALAWKDPAGNPTIPFGTDTANISWSVSQGVVSVDALRQDGAPVPLANNDPLPTDTVGLEVQLAETSSPTSASVDFVLTPTNNTVSPRNAAYFTVPAVANVTSFKVTNTTSVVEDPPGSGFYWADLTVKTFTVEVTGTPNGGSAFVECPNFSQSGALVVNCPTLVTLDSSGKATFQITAAGQQDLDIFFPTLRFGPVGFDSLAVQFLSPQPWYIDITPPDGSVAFAPAGGSIPVGFMVFDQYGDLFKGGSVVTLYRVSAGPAQVVGSQATNTGEGSINTVPSSATATQDVFFALGYAAGSLFPLSDYDEFTLRYGVTPTLAITGGVSTASSTVSTVVPGNGLIENPTAITGGTANTWTPVSVQVTVAGSPVPNAYVTFSGSDGVGFAYANGIPVTSGSATTGAKANFAGVATVPAYSTKTGTATVNAAAGPGTTSGTWSVATNSRFARDLSVDPTEATGKVGGTVIVSATVKDGFANAVPSAAITGEVTGVGRFLYSGNSLLTGLQTNSSGVARVEVGTQPAEEGVSSLAFQIQGGQAGNAANVPAGSGFAASSPNATSKITWSSSGPVSIVSPAQGSAISSGGYFGVTANSNLAEGTEVYLTLDGRAKAMTKVQANGLIRFDGTEAGGGKWIPAEPGKYAVRYGDAGSYMYSNEVSLNIKLFSITRFQENVSGDTDNFQIATGNWSRGTTINLTRNGISVAAVKVGAPGQPVAVKLAAKPGTYQVRVNSNQGYVYGDANGQVVVK